jgi:hypothetical protein
MQQYAMDTSKCCQEQYSSSMRNPLQQHQAALVVYAFLTG